MNVISETYNENYNKPTNLLQSFDNSFFTKNQAPFHLWRKKKLEKYSKVPKYYDQVGPEEFFSNKKDRETSRSIRFSNTICFFSFFHIQLVLEIRTKINQFHFE